MIDFHPDLRSLLLPNESPEDLANLNSAWTKEFPANSFLQTTLRNDLVRADWQRRRARQSFDQIQLDLHLTALPFELWDRCIQKHLQFFEKVAQRAQNEFRKALQFLAKFLPTPNTTKKPKDPPKPELNLDPDLTGTIPFEQTVYLEKDENGLWSHRYAPANERFTEWHPEDQFYAVVRQFLCSEPELPAQYEWVNIDDNKRYRTHIATLIHYTTEEFIKMIAQEAETGQLINGPRLKYEHYQDHEPIEILTPEGNNQ